ncbi:MAG TPA: vanadium-dependent haloperoxidase [Vicinamibacterales bacterium]|nr:vanadium-dependent haloperoxidase [Vicinamibacterales bacterium]
MYDAVNSIVGDRVPYATHLNVAHPASAMSAAVEAGYQVLLAEFPGQRAMLDSKYHALLADVPDSVEKSNGISVGAAVARQLLEMRANDGRNASITYVPGSGPGVWVPTPPGFLAVTTAFLARVTPFTMDSPSQFRPAGPPDLGSRKWLADYNEVKALGVSTGSTRSDEQTATALFWEPLAGTVWPATIRRIAREQSLDLATSARFQAAAFAAFADGLIACWDAKFHFNSWRPVTAIQQGDTDGNPRTDADPGWEPLAITPNFPEYPSGHTCATSAVAHTIENILQHEGLQHLSIPTRNVVSGQERFYRSADDAIDEVVEARMLLGLHFRSADEDGADLGRAIARHIRREFFRRR